MKKAILNLGKALNKATQQQINGGGLYCVSHGECPANQCCQSSPDSSSGFCGAVDNYRGLCNGQLPENDDVFFF